MDNFVYLISLSGHPEKSHFSVEFISAKNFENNHSPGGLPYENDGGAHRKFSKTPLKGTRISFCGRGFEFIYTPKRYQF